MLQLTPTACSALTVAVHTKFGTTLVVANIVLTTLSSVDRPNLLV